jgi:VCBS repeat-containing protein/CshA-type fibril repeat protein
MSNKKHTGLTRRTSGLMALEQRFMFDGAAIDTAHDQLVDATALDTVQLVSADVFRFDASTSGLASAAQLAQQQVRDYLTRATDAQLFELFNGGKSTPDSQWTERLSSLREALANGSFAVNVVAMDSASQFTALAAFTENGPNDEPTIFINTYWFGMLDAPDTSRALVEELGHAFDAYLNPNADSVGDEGESFADTVIDGSVSPEQSTALLMQNDHGQVVVNGVSYDVEFASLNFVNAYHMVYDWDTQNNSEDTTERWASKEQNLHYFNTAGLGSISISDGSNGTNFSGNDVSAVALTVGGQTYYGWISRPIKSNGIVRGFYFWTDTNFTSLALAQADGNQDGDSSVADNRGFVLVVDQTWFTQQIADTDFTKTFTSTSKDVINSYVTNGSTLTIASVGSSSDRVDAALNSVMPPNSPPVAANDTLTVAEDSGTTTVSAANGLLSNDSDANNDSLTITGYTIAGVNGTQTVGSTITISGVGDIRINADGGYTFTPVANYSGSVPPITYTVSDGNGGTTTAVLSITVTPVNDTPTASPDTKTISENTVASGTVIANDTDPDGDSLTVTGFTYSNGTSTVAGTIGSSNTITLNGVTVGTLILNANGTYSFTPASNYSGTVPVFNYTISDGNGGTASSTLTISLTTVNSAPVANPDNGDNSAYAVEAGCHVTGVDQSGVTLTNSGSDQTGNVLTNDTDPDASSTRSVTSVRSESGNGSTWDGTLVTTVTGRYGTLTITANGAYTFDINETNGAVNALNVGDVLNEYFTYTVTDNTGLTASSTLKIVIKGSNDVPVAVNDYDSVVELSASTTTNTVTNYGTASGSVYSTGVLGNDSDPDSSSLSVSTVEVSGAATADFLSSSGGGTSLSLTFSGTPASLSTSYYVYWLDGGANDASPVLLYSDSAHTTLLRPSAISGSGASRTATIGSAVVYDGSGNAHTLTNGDYIAFYTSSTPVTNNSKYYEAQISAAPVTANTITFNNITLTSGSLALGATVTFSGPTSGSGSITDIVYNANGNISSINVSSSTTFVSGSYTLTSTRTVDAGTKIEGQYGYLDLASNGTYTYYLTSNALIANQVFTEKFTYIVSDGTCNSTATLHINVNGTTGLVMDDETAVTNEDVTYASSASTNTSNNLLNGDSYNSSALTTITGFSWGGTTGTVGTSITKEGIGTLTINSDGYYTFAPATNYAGAVPSVLYTASNGTQSGQATLTISITPVDDASTLVNDSKSIPEDSSGSGNVLANDSDIDSSLSVASFTIAGMTGPHTLGGSVSVTDVNGTVGTLVLNSNGSYTFTPAANWNGTVPQITYTTNTGLAATLDINVTPLNDAPVVDLDGSGAGYNFTRTYTNGSAGVSIADTDSAVTDVDDTYIESAVITLINKQAGDALSVGTLPAGITASIDTSDAGKITVTLTSTTANTMTKADYEAAIEAITFASSGTSVDDRMISVQVNDGNLNSNVAYSTIDVSPDNRALTVTGTTVNEASPYVQFQVGGASEQWVSLALGTTGSGSGHATMGVDFLPNLQYFNGTSWVDYTGGFVQIPSGSTTLLVRTPVLQDRPYEGAETLKLTAYNQSQWQSGTGTSGNSTIIDDGTGDVYLVGNNTSTPTPSQTNGSPTPGYPTYLDDDRPITVDNIVVNEASPWAMFTITGYANQVLSLALSNGTATVGDGNPADGTEDYSPDLQYWNGAAWTAYNGTSVTMTGTTLLVRTAVHQDTLFEGQHVFNLGVTKQSSNTTVYGSASIYDDGTGKIYAFDNVNDGTPTITSGPGAGFDDDRTLTINSPLVNEASDYVVFTLTGNSGQTVSLQLQDESSNGTVSGKANILENQTLKIWDGVAWVNYDANNLPTFDGNGKIFVRVDIIAEQDSPYEGAETFKLNATLTGTSTAATGVATIIDDGTGVKYPGTFTNGVPTTSTTNLDNDNEEPAAPAPALPPQAPPPAAGPVTPLEPAQPLPPAKPDVAFNSELAPIAPALKPIEPPQPLAATLTSAGGPQFVASEAAPPGLTLFAGVTDQFIQTTDAATKISLPYDAFIHSNKEAVIKLQAKQADDSPLPKWVEFDPAAGTFTVKPPKDFKGKLDLKVIARDDDGREAVAIFQMFVGEQDQNTTKPQSRTSFTEKLRMAGKRPVTLVRIADAAHKVRAG